MGNLWAKRLILILSGNALCCIRENKFKYLLHPSSFFCSVFLYLNVLVWSSKVLSYDLSQTQVSKTFFDWPPCKSEISVDSFRFLPGNNLALVTWLLVIKSLLCNIGHFSSLQKLLAGPVLSFLKIAIKRWSMIHLHNQCSFSALVINSEIYGSL